MRLLYLTQVFETGDDPGSERHFYFCRYLARAGHEVTAITSNVNYKMAAIRFPGFSFSIVKRIEGVKVHYVYSYASFRGSYLRRIIYYLTYFCAALLASLRIPRPDVVYAVSTPLTVGLLGYCVSRLRGVPFVFEVTDVWPDAAIAVGAVRNPLLVGIARWMERLCYRKAAAIVALTEGIRRNIVGKDVPAAKVALITNGISLALFRDCDDPVKREALRRERDWGDRFICMYLGAHGTYNALGTIIDAAGHCRDAPGVRFVLVGDGDARRSLEERVANEGLTNVEFLSALPRNKTPHLLAAADAFLLPNRRGDFFRANLPNKLFDFLASARPIVVAGTGEAAEAVNRAEAGRVVPAQDGAAMATTVRELASLPEDERAAMGAAGRAFVFRHYNRERLSAGFAGIVTAIANGDRMPDLSVLARDPKSE